jgi:arsenate reductase
VKTKTILFACVHNAGRSQMAAAFFTALANPTVARAISAGTQPAVQVHPEVIAVMREVGIDLGQAIPRRLTDDLAHGTNLLITMGCGEACPIVPDARRQDWLLPDPKGKSIEVVRQIRDEIRSKVERLIATEHWERTETPT